MPVVGARVQRKMASVSVLTSVYLSLLLLPAAITTHGRCVRAGEPSSSASTTASASSTTVAATTATTATVTSHFMKTRVDLLFGFCKDRYKIASLDSQLANLPPKP